MGNRTLCIASNEPGQRDCVPVRDCDGEVAVDRALASGRLQCQMGATGFG